jgi:hypothetical protein
MDAYDGVGVRNNNLAQAMDEYGLKNVASTPAV